MFIWLCTMHIGPCWFQDVMISSLSLDPITFGDVLYIPGVGGLVEDTSDYCDANLNIWFIVTFGLMTTYSHGEDTCLLTFFYGASTHRSTGSFTLLTNSSMNESHSVTMDLYLPLYDVDLDVLFSTGLKGNLRHSLYLQSISMLQCIFLFMMLAYTECYTLHHFQQSNSPTSTSQYFYQRPPSLSYGTVLV